ncbi:hypothetical protein RB195_008636 [Necator americanus]
MLFLAISPIFGETAEDCLDSCSVLKSGICPDSNYETCPELVVECFARCYKLKKEECFDECSRKPWYWRPICSLGCVWD